jgi:hypothetical protein
MIGSKCPMCSHNRYNYDQFIKKANKIHDNRYNYAKTKYVDSYTKINVICHIHGKFKQVARSHLAGSGCPECSNHCKLNKKLFIKKSQLIHNNKYNYSKTKYVDRNTKVSIVCPEHGNFKQTPYGHLNGLGCAMCGIDKAKQGAIDLANKNRMYYSNKFIKQAKQIHGRNRYNYSQTIYQSKCKKVNIVCNKCKTMFQQAPRTHLSYHGCPICHKKKSAAVKLIESWLINHNITYELEKTIDGCRNPKTNKLLYFDFYIPSLNMYIEFDGMQHHRPSKLMSVNVSYRDRIKDKFCRAHHIKLLRIRYNQDIIKVLKSNINT